MAFAADSGTTVMFLQDPRFAVEIRASVSGECRIRQAGADRQVKAGRESNHRLQDLHRGLSGSEACAGQ